MPRGRRKKEAPAIGLETKVPAKDLYALAVETHEMLCDMVGTLYDEGADTELLLAASIHLNAGMTAAKKAILKL